MSKFFTKSDGVLLKLAGNSWFDDNGERFDAIFDAANELRDDASGQPILLTGSVIKCLTSIAKDFTRQQQLKDVHGRSWYVREVLMMDDGNISNVSIVRSLAECN